MSDKRMWQQSLVVEHPDVRGQTMERIEANLLRESGQSLSDHKIAWEERHVNGIHWPILTGTLYDNTTFAIVERNLRKWREEVE